ncbi:MAG TPA: hypothetical protein VMV79_03655 [Alphaproteobacteria bacterium]|nr:hypothetical protein [Alphaproteobacteria bacterium]
MLSDLGDDLLKRIKPTEAEPLLASDENFPLIAPRATISGMASFKPATGVRPNLYFGTGLSTTKAITRGLPFDFLGMVLGAEFVRRNLGVDKIIHEISDTHAVGNGFASETKIAALAEEQRSLIGRMVGALGLEGVYECLRASEYQATPEYQATLGYIKKLYPDKDRYFQLQWAGMNWLAWQRNVRIKVGWLTDDNPNPKGFDERCFDVGYDTIFASLNYVYVRCGRNVSPTRSRVSPYTSVEGEDRIMLAPGEDAASYFERWLCQPLTKDLRITFTHLANIVDGFERLFGVIEDTGNIWGNLKNGETTILSQSTGQFNRPILVMNLADKVNAILATVFGLRPESPSAQRNAGLPAVFVS